MDWGSLSGVALAMAIITLAMDWIMQYWLVIRWGPSVTKRLVIQEFKSRDTAREVREALDLPTRDEVRMLKEELRGMDVAYQTGLDARLAGLLDDIKREVKVAVNTDAIVSQIEKSLSKSMAGRIGKEEVERRKEFEALSQAYIESGKAKADAQIIYQTLVRAGVPPGAAALAAEYGPAGVEWALEQAFGRARARRLLDAIAERRELLQQGVSTFQPR